MGKKKSRRIRSVKKKSNKVPVRTNLPMLPKKEDEVTSLEKIYGKKPDGAALEPVLDALGRVNPSHRANNIDVNVTNKRRVSLFRDHTLEYPDLWLEVFVSPDPMVPDDEARFAQMFARANCHRANTPEDADLIVFAGGSDVDPSLYDEKPHVMTKYSSIRDTADMLLYQKCLDAGIPMLGICRGAQFLHVMNGGKLYQHVDGHYGDHAIYDIRGKQRIEKISSVHHQMVIENIKGGMEVIAVCSEAKNRWRNPKINDQGNLSDIEAFFYRDTCCIGIQGHPEYQNYNYFTKWVLELVNELVVCNPDVEFEGSHRRLKPDLLKERQIITSINTNPNVL